MCWQWKDRVTVEILWWHRTLGLGRREGRFVDDTKALSNRVLRIYIWEVWTRVIKRYGKGELPLELKKMKMRMLVDVKGGGEGRGRKSAWKRKRWKKVELRWECGDWIKMNVGKFTLTHVTRTSTQTTRPSFRTSPIIHLTSSCQPMTAACSAMLLGGVFWWSNRAEAIHGSCSDSTFR